MKNNIFTLLFAFLITFNGMLPQAAQANDIPVRSAFEAPLTVDDTCLDEYAQRNAYLKKFLVWAPPTVVVSLPVGSFVYFLGLYGLLNVAPSAGLFYAGFGLWYLAVPTIAVGTVALEAKYTVEYFKNREVVRVIDAIRDNRPNNKYVKKFIQKFRKKYKNSDISDEAIVNELYVLDRTNKLCDGNLTGKNSSKIQKLLAKRKHIFNYLGRL